MVIGFELGGVNIRLSRILFLSAFFMLLFELIIRLKLTKKILYLALFVVFLSTFAMIQYVFYPAINEASFFFYFFSYIEGVIILSGIFFYVRSHERLYRVIGLYVLSGFFALLLALEELLNYLLLGKFHSIFAEFFLDHYALYTSEGGRHGAVEGFSRLSAPFGEPNILASYLLTIFIIIITIKNAGRVRKYLYAFSLAALSILTLSKSATLSFLTLAALDLFNNRRLLTAMLWTIGISTLAVGYLYYVNHPLTKLFDARVENFYSGHDELLGSTLSEFSRLTFMEQILGKGLGCCETHRLLFDYLLQFGFLVGPLMYAIVALPIVLYLVKFRTEKTLTYPLFLVYLFVFLAANIYGQLFYPYIFITYALLTISLTLKKVHV